MTHSREEYKAAARQAAFEVIQTEDGCGCPNCSTRLPSRWIIHGLGGISGADWDLEDVLQTIDTAAEVSWQVNFAGHDLLVTEASGRRWALQVPIIR